MVNGLVTWIKFKRMVPLRQSLKSQLLANYKNDVHSNAVSVFAAPYGRKIRLSGANKSKAYWNR